MYNRFRTQVTSDVARTNPPTFFRRALKLVNGGQGQLPAVGSQGLTVASENPVYIQGNYNACGTMTANCPGPVTVLPGFGTTPGVDHVSASVLADAGASRSNCRLRCPAASVPRFVCAFTIRR